MTDALTAFASIYSVARAVLRPHMQSHEERKRPLSRIKPQRNLQEEQESGQGWAHLAPSHVGLGLSFGGREVLFVVGQVNKYVYAGTGWIHSQGVKRSCVTLWSPLPEVGLYSQVIKRGCYAPIYWLSIEGVRLHGGTHEKLEASRDLVSGFCNNRT